MSKIVLLSNHHVYTYNFRKEIIQGLLNENHEVHLVLPYGEKVDDLIEMGCTFTHIDLDRHGTNIFVEASLLRKYYKIIKKENPDYIISYTIKPNIYGGIVSKYLNIPIIPNITGLGSAVESPSALQKLSIQLYKFSFKNVKAVFFQNKENRQFFIDHNIAVGKHKMLPGSGVNLEKFYPLGYPSDRTIEFVFISRIMKEKGIDYYLQAAEYIREKYPNTKFHICGFCEEEYEDILEEYQKRGVVMYHGMVDDVRQIIEKTHCTVHPTYYPEGISNVLLESAASERPLITTDRSGTREVVDDGINGYLVNTKDASNLIDKIELFINLDYSEKKQMGKLGRKKVTKEFNRQIVVDAYLTELNSLYATEELNEQL